MLLTRFLLTVSILLLLLVSSKANNHQKELKELLEKHDVEHSDIVLAQAILETGWFKCSNCSWEHNNPFGFFWKGRYKEFRDLHHAVTYYKTWQEKWYKGGDYYNFLKKIGYAEDKKYISKLKSIVKKL